MRLGNEFAADPQPLDIRLHGAGAQATRLASYDPHAPIAITVTEQDAQRLDELAVVAVGPAGETVRIPLTPAPDGAFTGTLELADEGTWQLRMSTRVGTLRTDTTPISLDVVAPPPSDAWLIGLGVGATIFIVIGGNGFVVLRRTMRRASSSTLGHAA